jgi:hypothetical protein
MAAIESAASGLRAAKLIRINPFRAIQRYTYGWLIGATRRSSRKAKELSMISSNMGSLPAQFPQKSNVIGDCGAPGPMPQQDADGSHGHEMHPQKFVQLVGCHDSNAARHEGARLH